MKSQNKISNQITSVAFYAIGLLIPLIVHTGCKKDWLDAKPNKTLVIPKTIADYQAMIDNASSDVGFNIDQPAFDELGAGDFYMTTQSWSSRMAFERNTFIWAKGDVYEGDNSIADWNVPYQRIFKANVILEGIEQISPMNNNEQLAWRDVKGAALFFRAYDHYSIAQIFCKPYTKASAGTDLGIPLRLTPDFNVVSARSTVENTYHQVLTDLIAARTLLPVPIPNTMLYKNRPTKLAADAMLARVHLAMGNYDSAFWYSDNCLQQYNKLMDYNQINAASLTPFQRFNDEVIFQKILALYGSFFSSRLIVDSTLFNSYSSNDLRKTCFFRLRTGVNTYKGSYDPSGAFFSGLATDEMYLIRAEASARNGNFVPAMQDLNNLLRTRWKKVNGVSTYVDQTAVDANDALKKILVERRKELCFRGLRWTDLRRLNRESQFAVTLTRVINGQTYTLPPNDERYVLPVPDYVIKYTGMQQNPR